MTSGTTVPGERTVEIDAFPDIANLSCPVTSERGSAPRSLDILVFIEVRNEMITNPSEDPPGSSYFAARDPMSLVSET